MTLSSLIVCIYLLCKIHFFHWFSVDKLFFCIIFVSRISESHFVFKDNYYRNIADIIKWKTWSYSKWVIFFVIYILTIYRDIYYTNCERYTDESFGFCVETLRFISIFNPITTTLYTKDIGRISLNKYTKISHFLSDFDTSIPVNFIDYFS